MASVAGRTDSEREVRAAAQLAIHTPVGLDDTQYPVGVKALGSAQRRNEVGIAGHQNRRVAAIASKKLEQAGTDGDVRLLLLPRTVAAATHRTDEDLRLELAEMHVDTRRLQRREVGDLPSHSRRVVSLTMMRDGGEVVDGRDGTATWQGVSVGATQARNVEPAQSTTGDRFGVERRMVQVETVDKEHAAVDDDPREEETPGSQPRGGHGIYPWGRTPAVWHRWYSASRTCCKYQPFGDCETSSHRSTSDVSTWRSAMREWFRIWQSQHRAPPPVADADAETASGRERLLTLEHGSQHGHDRRQVLRDRAPRDVRVHAEVLVDDEVAHVADVSPRNLGPALRGLFGNVGCYVPSATRRRQSLRGTDRLAHDLVADLRPQAVRRHEVHIGTEQLFKPVPQIADP